MITACKFIIHIATKEGLIVFISTDSVDNLYVYFESIIPHVILVISRKYYVYNSRTQFYVNLYSIVGRWIVQGKMSSLR